ncbi:MAG TPA: HAD hydrolase-like protein [Bryobacteraceae bacterium]|nr:HAD hydrolase-like protein [Bryobacteraceae bacterium]
MHPALVLFDIDGTLVRRAGPHHRQALVDAVRRVTGLETSTDHIPVHGMLDPDILTRMLRDAGASRTSIRRAMPDLIRSAQRIYVRSVPNLQRKTCPGVRLLLRRLQRRGVLLGLVTGNLTRIGWKKLDRAGLKPYFRLGAFGEMAKDRAGLARLAIRHSRAQGWIGRHTPVSLVGDAPSDIIAAQRNGIRSIAVYTGISTRDDLLAYSPDILLEDLRRLTLRTLLDAALERPRANVPNPLRRGAVDCRRDGTA